MKSQGKPQPVSSNDKLSKAVAVAGLLLISLLCVMTKKISQAFIVLKKHSGYSLMEGALSIAVFSIVLVSSSALINSLSMAASKTAIQQELFDSGRMAVEFITDFIARADDVSAVLGENNTLLRLKLKGISSDPTNDYVFLYDNSLSIIEPMYRRISFGNQELISNVNRLTLKYNETRQLITITLAVGADPSTDVWDKDKGDCTFTKQVSARHKKVVIRK